MKRVSTNRRAPRWRPSREDCERAYYAGKAGDSQYLRQFGRRATVEGEYGSVEKAWRRGVDAARRPPPRPLSIRAVVGVAAESARPRAKQPPGPRPRVTLATYRAHPNPKGSPETDGQRAIRLTRVLGVTVNRQKARRLRIEDERTD